MFPMRARLQIGTWAVAASIVAVGATTAIAASPPAINGGATQITTSSATLNGTVDTTDPAAGDSAWTFQYGTTTNYDHQTKAVVIGPEDQAVSAQISGLEPNTTYHFRLVVAQNINYNPTYSMSADGSFTTSANGSPPPVIRYGVAGLTNRRLKIRSGYVSIPFKCSGAAGAECKGAVLIAATGKLGKSKKASMYGCAGGSFSTVAGRSLSLTTSLSRSCKALLSQARHKQLKATLRATYSTHQSTLRTTVTLLG